MMLPAPAKGDETKAWEHGFQSNQRPPVEPPRPPVDAPRTRPWWLTLILLVDWTTFLISVLFGGFILASADASTGLALVSLGMLVLGPTNVGLTYLLEKGQMSGPTRAILIIAKVVVFLLLGALWLLVLLLILFVYAFTAGGGSY